MKMRIEKWVVSLFAVTATVGLLGGCASTGMRSSGDTVASPAMSHRELDPSAPGGSLVAGPSQATAVESETVPRPLWAAGGWILVNGVQTWYAGY
jgi:hypothetical protein